MKKIILSLLIAVSAMGVIAPTADAATVVFVHRHHRHRHPHPNMVWVPGRYVGHFWHRHWVPGHWVPA